MISAILFSDNTGPRGERGLPSGHVRWQGALYSSHHPTPPFQNPVAPLKQETQKCLRDTRRIPSTWPPFCTGRLRFQHLPIRSLVYTKARSLPMWKRVRARQLKFFRTCLHNTFSFREERIINIFGSRNGCSHAP